MVALCEIERCVYVFYISCCQCFQDLQTYSTYTTLIIYVSHMMGCAQSRHSKPAPFSHRLSRVPLAPDYHTATQQWPRGGWGHSHNAKPAANRDSQYPSMRELNRARHAAQGKELKRRKAEQQQRVYAAKVKPQVRTRENKPRPSSRLIYPSIAEMERNTFWGPAHKAGQGKLTQRYRDSVRNVEFRYEDAYTCLAGNRPGEGHMKKSKPMAPPPHVRRPTPVPRQQIARQQIRVPQQQLSSQVKPSGRSSKAVNFNTDYTLW